MPKRKNTTSSSGKRGGGRAVFAGTKTTTGRSVRGASPTSIVRVVEVSPRFSERVRSVRTPGVLPVGLKTGKPRVFRLGRVASSAVRRQMVKGIPLLSAVLKAFPKKADPCIAKSVRKEVMHALGVAGKKGVGAGKPRDMSRAKVRC